MITRIALGCIALGVVLGTATDDHPERPVVMRGPWRVLQADFHAHSRHSDGFLSPPELVIQASRRGLDVLAVTEHNLVFPAKIARWWSSCVAGPTIIIGEEVTTRGWHVHALGIENVVSPSLSLPEAIAEIHRQGGLAFAAHPVKRYWPALVPVIDQLDGAELMHPISLRAGRGSPRSDWSGEHFAEFFTLAAERGKRLTAIGSSDYHFGSALGRPRTFVFTRGGDAPTDVMEALRAGRTAVQMPDGQWRGDPEAVRLMGADPVIVAVEYDNASTGALDSIGRVLGMLGLIALVGLRRGRLSKPWSSTTTGA